MGDQLKRVTILDDNEAIAEDLATLLQHEGFEARATTDADEFVEWVSSWHPALAFVDIVGHDHDAMSVLDRMARARSRAGIVLMSGADRGGIRAAREFGAAKGLVHAGLLRKPFNRTHVVAAIARNPHALESVERVADPLVGWSEEQLSAALQQAISHHELRVVYQPQISCATGWVVGFEALARWDHPTLGHIPPSTFIPYAAEQGLIRPITHAVTTSALQWFAAASRSPEERIAFNLTTAELNDEAQLRQLKMTCDHFGVAPEQVALEVNHTSALADDPASLAVLRELDAEGFHLVIDDFGTGYSTAARLTALPFSAVKIDTRFVRKCLRSDAAAAAVEAMIGTARDLEMDCYAQGVENQQILDKLIGWGCENAQGYYIARPMPSAELEIWLDAAR